MTDFFHWLTETREGGQVSLALVIGAVGLFFYGMNWAIFINNRIPGRKWSSMVPPLGGLLIAVALLVAGLGWWALLGLTDPCVFIIIYSLIKKPESNKNKETDENGKHDD